MCGNQAHNATGSHTWSQDAPDAQDSNLTSLASGWNTDAPDAPKIFADVPRRILQTTKAHGPSIFACL